MFQFFNKHIYALILLHYQHIVKLQSLSSE